MVRVAGEGDPPPTSELLAAMQDQMTQETAVRLEIVPEHIEEFVVLLRSETE